MAEVVVLAWSSSAIEQHATYTSFAPTIVVVNDGSVAMWVQTDGGTAVAKTAPAIPVEPNGTLVLSNQQPLMNNNTTPNANQSETQGWTPQGAVANYASAPSYVSIIPEGSCSSNVSVSFQ